MILAMLLLSSMQPIEIVAAPPEDIVVVGKRLRQIRFDYHARAGQLVRCHITKPSGSATADAMACEAARQCAAEQPDVGDRRLAPCIRDRVQALFAAYRAGRTAPTRP